MPNAESCRVLSRKETKGSCTAGSLTAVVDRRYSGKTNKAASDLRAQGNLSPAGGIVADPARKKRDKTEAVALGRAEVVDLNHADASGVVYA